VVGLAHRAHARGPRGRRGARALHAGGSRSPSGASRARSWPSGCAR
jgi:hypothetical protein